MRALLHSQTVTILLSIGIVFSALTLVTRMRSFHLPGNHQGYAPEQPIRFSHRLHAGELSIDCLYCHSGAERSRHAGIPSADTCMKCHKFVTAPFGAIREDPTVVSTEIKKIYDTLGLAADRTPDPDQPHHSIEWTKVHNLPDFVYFDHRAHVGAGVACQSCHGPVETMERMYQVEDLTMGWCVNCHRKSNEIGVGGNPVNASLDCVTCHY